jgi:site-specific DNA recombinase
MLSKPTNHWYIKRGLDNQAPDQALIQLLGRARSIQDAIESSVSASIEEIASSKNITPSYATRLMRLNYLAPDIVEAIIAGRQPPGLSANKLIKDTRFPLAWHEQRIALGFEQTRTL